MLVAQWPRRLEVALHPCRRGVFQRGRIPAWIAILVDQQGADAFLQVALYAGVQGRDIFLTEYIGQREQAGALEQGERQAR